MSWRRGSSETMLSRIRSSTRASSLVTPKSCEPVIGAVPIRAIKSAYIIVSWVPDRRRPRGCGSGHPRRRKAGGRFTAGSGPADGLIRDGRDGPHRDLAVGRDALDRGRDRLEACMDHVI